MMKTEHIKALLEFAETAICRFCNNTGAVQVPPDGEPEPCMLCDRKKKAVESLRREIKPEEWY